MKAFERGLQAAKDSFKPAKYQAAGKGVTCSHCGADIFETPKGLIGRFSGWVLQCCCCGHLECFGKEPAIVQRVDPAEGNAG